MTHEINTSPRGNRTEDAPQPADHEELAAKQLNILVADDTPTFQTVISSLLQRRGHCVSLAENGREAVELFLNARFDVIVLDVKMPYMDGLEVAREIRRHEQTTNRHTLIVALTTHSLAHDREECLAAGMDAYLTKPVNAAKLIQLVEQGAEQFSNEHGSSNGTSNGSSSGSTNADSEGESVVQFEAAIRRLGGDLELFQEFITVFDEDMPELLRSLRRAVADQNGPDIERDAHSLRGLISNFGAPLAVRAAECLEEMGKAKLLSNSDVALQRLEDEVGRLDEALARYRA